MRRLSTFPIAFLLAFGAVAIPPEAVVQQFLPDRYVSYHERLVSGLWLTKVFLLIDALFLGAWPVIHRRLFLAEPPRADIPLAPVLTRLDYYALILLALLAFGLRAYRISSGYAADEITVSMSMAERPLPQLLMRAEPYRLVPAFLAHFLYKIFGVSEAVGRLPSLVAGVASVPLLYLLARRWSSPGCAAAASAFLALSTFHVWYSQLVTSYALALFFLILMMLFFEDCLRDPSSVSWYRWGGIVFLAILTHFQLALFVVFAQAVRLICRQATGFDSRIQLWRFVAIGGVSSAIAATVFAPNFFIWSSIIVGLTSSSDHHLLLVEPRGTVPIQMALFYDWLCNQYSPWFLRAVIGLAAILGGVLFIRRRTGVALYLMLPTIILWSMFCVGVIRRITPRHSIFTLIPMSFFVGLAIADAMGLASRNGGRERRPVAWSGIFLILLAPCLANALISLRQYFAVDRFPFKPAAGFVGPRVRSDEPVFGMGYGHVEFGYYLPRIEPVERPERIGEILDRREPAWFIGLGPGFIRGMPESLRTRFLNDTFLAFSHHGRLEQYKDLNDAFVYRYSPTSARRPTRPSLGSTADRRAVDSNSQWLRFLTGWRISTGLFE